MAFLFRRNKSKNDTSSSSTKSSNRNVSTRILQINLDEVKQQMDAEDEAKKQAQSKKMLPKKKKKDDNKTEYPEIKFRIEVEYNNHSWTIDRALNEFIELRKNLGTATNNQLRPFALFPYGVSGGNGSSTPSGTGSSISSDTSQSKKSKFALSSMPKSQAISSGQVTNTNMANAEAPFLREIRLALDRWLDAIIANPDVQQTSR